VNGALVTTLGSRARTTDRILVDGKPVAPPAPRVYWLLNKPAGVVTSARDPQGRPTVVEMVPREVGRLFPVGRLDVQSTGLVLMTNDGALAARLAHPRHHLPRTYRVKIDGTPSERTLARMRRGVRLDDGRTGSAEVIVEKALPTKTWLRVVAYEGRSHLVRRLCLAVGHPVDKLERVGFGPLRNAALGRGAARPLTEAEVRALRRAAGRPDAQGEAQARRRPRGRPRKP
jgi:23S rRNA pseudouridine2605 synthase